MVLHSDEMARLGSRIAPTRTCDFAFVEGASCLEGYPAIPAIPSQTLPGAFVWTGVPAMFAAAGFRAIACKGKLRRLSDRDSNEQPD